MQTFYLLSARSMIYSQFGVSRGKIVPFKSNFLGVSMSLKRNVSLSAALGYKGQGPYLTFILHRIGGSALFIFFTVYILALLGVESMFALMSNWLFQVILLVFGLFHAINGLRITILDLWPKLIEHFRTVINIEWVVYALIAGFAVIVVLQNAMGG
jgi:succinate dehydrogenase / fumarate reductase cytochrome b subunit